MKSDSVKARVRTYTRGLRWMLGPGLWGRERWQGTDKVVLLAGSGRSGTTWIADLLNCDNAYRSIFEPFDHRRARSDWIIRQPNLYVPVGSGDAALAERCRHLFYGRFRAMRCDGDNQAWVASGRLIKAIRANLMLGWLRDVFPDLRIGLLLRHPFSVALSQARYGGAFPSDVVGELCSQPALYSDWLAPHADFIARLDSDFTRRVAFWCIQNRIPLTQLEPDDAYVLFFEDVMSQPEQAVPAAQKFLGLPEAGEELREYAERPSRTVRLNADESATARGAAGKNRSKWEGKLSQEDIELGTQVLQVFGMDRVYDVHEGPKCRSGAQPLTLFAREQA
jgi:hypothetical protein